MHKHNLLTELEEPAKDILQSYNILEEEFEQLKLSESISQLQKEGSCASNQDARTSSVSTGSGNLKPKSLISKSPTVSESYKKDAEKRVPVAKDRTLNIKNPGRSISVKDSNVNSLQTKSQKSKKVDSNRDNAKAKGSTKESVNKEGNNSNDRIFFLLYIYIIFILFFCWCLMWGCLEKGRLALSI